MITIYSLNSNNILERPTNFYILISSYPTIGFAQEFHRSKDDIFQILPNTVFWHIQYAVRHSRFFEFVAFVTLRLTGRLCELMANLLKSF